VRIVSNSSDLWRAPGIAGTHVSAVLEVDEWNSTPLKLWADRVSLRRKIAMKKIPSDALPQGSPEWLKWRGDGVGGSEVATVCGENPYETKMSLWKSKVAARRGEPVSDGGENEHMRRGKELEPHARAEYEQLMGWACPPLCVVHDDLDFVRCSLDGLREDGELVLEIKAPGARNHAKAIDLKRNPEDFRFVIPHYHCQVQYQLLIVGASKAHFASYNKEKQFQGGNRLVIVPVEADPDFQEAMLNRVVRFWKLVEDETPPSGV